MLIFNKRLKETTINTFMTYKKKYTKNYRNTSYDLTASFSHLSHIKTPNVHRKIYNGSNRNIQRSEEC
jgi:hypothetical protein